MKVGRKMAALVVAAGLVGLFAGAAGAENEAELKARIQELEQNQAEMREEMRELRELLKASRKAPDAAAVAADGEAAAAPAEDPKVVEVERKQNVITEEVRKIREALAIPESKELKSEYGLGPAASKVYGVTRGLSLGGYGEFNYKDVVNNRGTGPGDEFDMLRFVAYTGYKFTDRILFNSEVEFEHARTASGARGSIAVEFAALDFLTHPMANVRAGLVLVPMGFLNEIHEPPFFHGNVRPPVENDLLPSTWRSGGVGLFGELVPGLTYRTYAITGFDAKGFRSSGIRGGRQNGSFERADDWAWVGRIDYSPIEMLTFGGSGYVGNSGQKQSYAGRRADVLTQIYEGHAQLRTHGFEGRVLGTWLSIDDAAALSMDPTINPNSATPDPNDFGTAAVAGQQWGWYAEAAYNVLPLILDTDHYLAPWFRFSMIDLQDDMPFGFAENENLERDVYEVGLSYKPIPNVVLKLDYRHQDAESGIAPDELRVGAGFAY